MFWGDRFGSVVDPVRPLVGHGDPRRGRSARGDGGARPRRHGRDERQLGEIPGPPVSGAGGSAVRFRLGGTHAQTNQARPAAGGRSVPARDRHRPRRSTSRRARRDSATRSSRTRATAATTSRTTSLTLDYDAGDRTSSTGTAVDHGDGDAGSLELRSRPARLLDLAAARRTARPRRSRATAQELVITPRTGIRAGYDVHRRASTTRARRRSSPTPTSRSRAGSRPTTAPSSSASRRARRRWYPVQRQPARQGDVRLPRHRARRA